MADAESKYKYVMKKLLFCTIILLFTACTQKAEEPEVRAPELCQRIDVEGAVYYDEPQNENYFEKIEPTLLTDDGAWFEIPVMNMKFMIPSDYSGYNVFLMNEEDDQNWGARNFVQIDEVDRGECLPVGDGGSTSLNLLYWGAGELGSDWDGLHDYYADRLDVEWSDFETPSLGGKILREKWFGGSYLEANYFLQGGHFISLGTVDCVACKDKRTYELKQEILKTLQPIGSVDAPCDDGTGMRCFLKEIQNKYLSSLGDMEDWELVIDEENLYAEIRSMDLDGSATVTVFLTSDRTPVVGVSVLGCGPICHQDLNFLKWEGEAWQNVTKEVFPSLSEAEEKNLFKGEEYYNALYELPQFGTTIELINQYEEFGEDGPTVYYRFLWEDGVFTSHDNKQ